MWTLILTVIMTSNGNFSEIKTIEKFDTKQLCETAGNQWYKDVSTKQKPYIEGYHGRQYIFTCVKLR